MLKLNAFQLKIIAVVGMMISHIPYMFWGVFSYPVLMVMGALGGLTFPIMAYFAVEGYRHTRSLPKYLLRLVAVGLVAMPFHRIVMDMVPFNIMFSIALGLVTLWTYDHLQRKWLFWVLYVLMMPVFTFVWMEYMLMGNLMMLLFHIIKDEKRRHIIPPIVSGVGFLALAAIAIPQLIQLEAAGLTDYVREQMGMGREFDLTFMTMTVAFASTMLWAVPLLLSGYTGERGQTGTFSKWLFYVIYPLHLAILAGLGWLLRFIGVPIHFLT